MESEAAGLEPTPGGTHDAAAQANARLYSALYFELRRIARSQLRKQGGWSSLSATTLVHEVWLRLSAAGKQVFADRGHFLGYVARTMRTLSIDHARKQRALKRSQHLAVTWREELAPPACTADPAALADALEELSRLDPQLAELVDLHSFGGLSFAEIAALRSSSERTVQRDWQKARLLLRRALRDDAATLSTAAHGGPPDTSR